MTDINVGAISEALNNKLDRNGLNAGNPCAVVIKTFVDGTSGYRIWSDGYCEQWGKSVFNSIGPGVDFTNNISLIKSYNSTNYSILANINATSGGGSHTVSSKNQAENGFGLVGINRNTGASISGVICWQTSGYIR